MIKMKYIFSFMFKNAAQHWIKNLTKKRILQQNLKKNQNILLRVQELSIWFVRKVIDDHLTLS